MLNELTAKLSPKKCTYFLSNPFDSVLKEILVNLVTSAEIKIFINHILFNAIKRKVFDDNGVNLQ